MAASACASAAADAATTWHASPTGPASGPCSVASPCSANYALVDNPVLADGDTVVLGGGDYSIAVGIKVAKRISIEGAATGAPTRLIGGPGTTKATLLYAAVADLPAHITDIQATNQTGGNAALYLGNQPSSPLIIDRVRGEQAAGPIAAGLLVSQEAAAPSNVVLRNSVGRTLGQDSDAILLRGPRLGSAGFDVRNVVADARGAGSIGLLLRANSDSSTTCGTVTASFKNSYARSADGPNQDLTAAGDSAGVTQCKATLESSHSNWRDLTLVATGTISSSVDQHSSNALFADAAGGDYHQLAGSPTIDAGVADALNGDFDFDGQSRNQGAAPDIGADEFPVAAKDGVAPAGNDMKFGPQSFRTDRGPSSIARVKRHKKGSTVSYKLSENAAVAFTVERQVKGHKKRKKCSAKRRKGKRCTLFKALKGSFSHASTAGANSFHFTGYLNGKKLKPGKYRMSGVPTDGAGNHGAVFKGTFTIVRR